MRSQYVSFYQKLTSGLLVTAILGTMIPGSLFAASGNLISNGDLETASSSAGIPDLWSKAGFGTNDGSLSYPVAGNASEKAAFVTISSYTDGDAKWMFTPVAVIPGNKYVYADDYLSSASTTLTAEFFDNAHVHLSFAGFITVSPSSGSSTWGKSSAEFTAPAGAAYMTVFHSLASVGSLTIDNASLSETVVPHGTLSTQVEVVGGTATPADFSVSITKAGAPFATFAGSASGTVTTLDSDIAYDVNASSLPHYKSSRSAGCSGTLSDGGSATCALTEIFLSGTTTQLNVVANVVNTHGGTNDAADFVFTVTNGSSTPVSFTGGRTVNILPDTIYAVSVNAGMGYAPAYSKECSGKLMEGDTVTCMVTLSDQAIGAAPPNLIPNPGLETPSSSNASVPEGWLKGQDWGTNVATYQYPVDGTKLSDSDISVSNAARVSFASYIGDVLTGGDGKWYFEPVAIMPGHRYKFQDSYISDTTTYLVAEFFDAAHAHISLDGFIAVPPSQANAWKISGATFTAPAGAAFMTVYHQLNSTGSLTIDNLSLTDDTLADAFPQGFVSLTFDDGYKEHFTTVKDILDQANEKATFYIVSHDSGFGVTNSSLETADPTDGARPLDWVKLEGTNATFQYPAEGHTGIGASVTATAAGSGAAWYHSPTTVLADQSFKFSHFYKSTGDTQVFIQVADQSGQLSYADSDGVLSATKQAYATLPSAADWTEFKSRDIFLPPGSHTVTVIHQLVGAGTLTIDDEDFGSYLISMTPEQILALQADGHEIAGHTQTHADLNSLSALNAKQEVEGGRNDLLNGKVSPTLSFAYPYGNNSPEVQAIVRAAGFTSGRGVIDGYNGRNTNRFSLFSKNIHADTKLSDIEAWINQAVTDHTWLILTFHQVDPAAAGGSLPYGTTPETLSAVVDFLKTNNITVRTVAEGASLMNGATPVPPTSTSSIVIASHANVEASATTSSGITVTYNTPLVSGSQGVIASCLPVSGSVFALGTTTVTCTAHDTLGSNALPTTFFVHVSLGGSTTPVVTPPSSSSGSPGGSVGASFGVVYSPYWGCTNPKASNYNRLANIDDRSCVIESTSTVPAPSVLASSTMNASTSPTFTSPFFIQRPMRGGTGGEVLGTQIVKFRNRLKFGSHGDEVGQLQNFLRSHGFYSGPITKYFGTLTRAALKSFQQSHGLEAVGYIGPKTLHLLNDSIAEVIVSTPNVISINTSAKP